MEIVLRMKEYLKGFFLQDNWISLQWWWPLDILLMVEYIGGTKIVKHFIKACVN